MLDLFRVETDEMSDPDERDAAVSHESAHLSH
jgi:hypothetical protein